jgi:hypothetical protein
MSGPLPWIFGAAALCLLVLAYKVGRVVLRILVGLVVLALLGWGFWHFLLK